MPGCACKILCVARLVKLAVNSRRGEGDLYLVAKRGGYDMTREDFSGLLGGKRMRWSQTTSRAV